MNFKYRVWSHVDNKFLDHWRTPFALLPNGRLLVSKSGFYEHLTNTNPGDFVVQLGMDVEDVSGKDIYEGDIVRYRWDYCEHDVEEFLGQVSFKNGLFLIGVEEFAMNDCNLHKDTLTVVGYMFENTKPTLDLR